MEEDNKQPRSKLMSIAWIFLVLALIYFAYGWIDNKVENKGWHTETVCEREVPLTTLDWEKGLGCKLIDCQAVDKGYNTLTQECTCQLNGERVIKLCTIERNVRVYDFETINNTEVTQ